MDMLAVLLATGINPDRSVVFHQDDNHNHTQLAWILNCLCPMGKLRRMTTWKSKLATFRNASDESEVDESLLNAGLFNYPVLQAADILAYRATHVPVGQDQRQHLELSRDLADVFNRTYKREKPLFPLPQHLITPSRRILSLRDPLSKMSKSSPDVQSRILLTDDFSQIKSKIRSAVTDSEIGITYDPINRPGTTNLLTILAACADEDPIEVGKRYARKGHGDLKTDVADAVEQFLNRPRDEFQRLRHEIAFLSQVAREGAQKAITVSDATMREVKSCIGLA